MQAVLFDLDGTLHDHDAGVRAFLAAQHAEIGLARHGVDLGLWTERFVELEERGLVWKDAVYAHLVAEFALPHSPDPLLDGYVRGFAAHAVPHSGHREVLASLREAGWRTGIVTNGRSAFQRATIQALGIEPLLDIVVVSEEVGLRKPDPRILGLALRELGCEAAGSWFVGDDPVADVQGANGTGMRALLVSESGARGVFALSQVPSLVGGAPTVPEASRIASPCPSPSADAPTYS